MNRKTLFILVLFALLLALPGLAGAQDMRSSGLPLPRWAALQGDKTYVRAGPGLRYPIKWVFRKRGLPVEIVQEFDSWRKIRDWEGGEGWVHQSLLSGARSGLTQSDILVPMYAGDSTDAKLVARLEAGVVVAVDRCAAGWCRVTADGYAGWVQRNFLWGIYEDEELN